MVQSCSGAAYRGTEEVIEGVEASDKVDEENSQGFPTGVQPSSISILTEPHLWNPDQSSGRGGEVHLHDPWMMVCVGEGRGGTSLHCALLLRKTKPNKRNKKKTKADSSTINELLELAETNTLYIRTTPNHNLRIKVE